MNRIQSTGKTITTPASQQLSRDYTLNKSKALSKKLEATRSEHLSYKITGGGIRLFFSTASFEVFKQTCKHYYEQLNTNTEENREISVNLITDKSHKNIVEEQIKVSENSTDSLGRAIKRKCFCINIYLTTSSVLVNGKGLHLFCENDLPLIVVAMKEYKINGKNVDFNEMNRVFEEIIALENQECNSSGIKTPSKEQTNNSKTSTPIPSISACGSTFKAVPSSSFSTPGLPGTSTEHLPVNQLDVTRPIVCEDLHGSMENDENLGSTLQQLVTIVHDLKERVEELEITIQANNLSNSNNLQIINDRLTALMKARVQHDIQSSQKLHDIEDEIINVNKNLEKRVDMLQGKTQNISDKLRTCEGELVQLNSKFEQSNVPVQFNIPVYPMMTKHTPKQLMTNFRIIIPNHILTKIVPFLWRKTEIPATNVYQEAEC